jgi:hypothetical protein
MRSKIKGVISLRKKLRALPDAIALETSERMNEVGDQMVSAMRQRVRRRTGKLAALIRRTRVTPKSLKLRAGILGKLSNGKGFYQKFYEFGFKAGSKLVKRVIKRSTSGLFGRALIAARKAGGAGISSYTLNWKPRRPEYNIRGALGGKTIIGKTIIKGLVADAFRKTAGIARDDNA